MVSPRHLTLHDFLQLPNIEASPAWEFPDQIPVQKPIPTLHHSRLQKRLVALIDNASNLYEALRCVLSTNSIVPNIAITRITRLPNTNQPLEEAPDWLIEILALLNQGMNQTGIGTSQNLR